MPDSPNLTGVRVRSAKPNLDGIRYQALGRAHEHLKRILEEHGQHLSKRVLKDFRESLGRMGGTLRLPPTLDGITVKKSAKGD